MESLSQIYEKELAADGFYDMSDADKKQCIVEIMKRVKNRYSDDEYIAMVKTELASRGSTELDQDALDKVSGGGLADFAEETLDDIWDGGAKAVDLTVNVGTTMLKLAALL